MISRYQRTMFWALLQRLGAKRQGALTFLLKDEAQAHISTTFRPVSPEELQDRLSRRLQVSIARWDNKPRLSVAGVQGKLPLLVKANGEMGFGEGNLASTHLFKFGQKPAMNLVINEYLCMELAPWLSCL